ncbi:MAG: tetratricopeptide repeat protein [Candidatus Nitrospinota bacterium M3_3B_026]
MKLTAALAAFLALLFSAAAPASGEDRIKDGRYFRAEALKIEDLASNGELGEAFTGWMERIEDGDGLGAFDEANRILNTMRDLGTRNLFPLADIALAVGRETLDKGDGETAVTAAQHAVMFAPDHPRARFFLAHAIIARDKTDVKNAGAQAAAGVRALFSNRIQRGKFIAAAARYAYMALLVAFLLTFLACAAKNYRALLSDITDFIPTHPEGAWKAVMGALVLLVPLAVGGWLVFLLAIPLFLWPYLKTGGKAVVALFVLFLFSGPYTFHYMARGVTLPDAETYRALYLLSENTWDYSTKKRLEQELEKNPDAGIAAFALGYLNKLRQDKDAAIGYYDMMLEKDPDNVRALVNKGNVYFLAKEYDKTVDMYEKAIKADPRSVEAHFNLSNAYAFMAKTKDSEKEYNIALSIDLDRTRELVEATGEGSENKVADFPITSRDLSRYERAMARETETVADVLWSVYFGPVSKELYRWASAGFVLLLGAAALFWNRRLSHQVCASCGTPFRPPIRLASPFPKCNQCVAATLSKGGVSSAKKDRKRKEMRQFARKRNRTAGWLDRLLPGVGRSYHHEAAAGFPLTFITSVMLVYAVAMIGSELVIYKTPLSAELAREHAVFLAAAALYWLAMNTVFMKDYY